MIPLALLLCVQWPLRDWIHAYSREANDLAQVLFGIYVSVAITYATRVRVHLTPEVLAQRYPARFRSQLFRYTSLCIVVPWSLFILYAATPMVLQSIRQLERFPDTFNPGYFILKISMWLLALLVFFQTLVDAFRVKPSDSPEMR